MASLLNIRATNFKRFDNITLNTFKPINLIYGENSSGKSSIIKSILTLKQTASHQNENEALSIQGDYVDLGTYKDFIKDHSTNNRLGLGVTFPGHGDPWINDEEITAIRYDFTYRHDKESGLAKLETIFISIITKEENYNNAFELRKNQRRDWYDLSISKEAISYYSDLYGKPKAAFNKKAKVKIDGKFQFTQLDAKNQTSHSKDKSLQYIIYDFERQLRWFTACFEHGVYYLAPLRNSPHRSYKRTSHKTHVGIRGEYTPSVIENIKNKNIDTGVSALETLQEWIDIVFPGYRIDTKPYDELVKINITKEGRTKKPLSDVGFGFSQVLPIMAQAAAMNAGALLIIEQPELHLHPKAQANFAKFLVSAAKRNICFLIETHSEHLLRGLQLEISKATLEGIEGISHNDISITYVPQEPDQPFEIGMNEFGELLNEWPEGFFDEAYNLSLQLIKNKIKITETTSDNIEKSE